MVLRITNENAIDLHTLHHKIMHLSAEADLGFSRGGGRIFEKKNCKIGLDPPLRDLTPCRPLAILILRDGLGARQKKRIFFNRNFPKRFGCGYYCVFL